MKKIALILALAMALSLFAGCGNTAGETTATTEPAVTAPEGTTEELLNKLYENVTVELPLMTMPVDLTDMDAVTYMTGLTDADNLAEVSVSEPMMGSQAYSVLMVRVTDEAEAETVAQNIFDNIDTRKWICVEASTKQAAVCGDLVLFVMLDPQYGVSCDQIVEAFTTVCGGTVESVIK